MTAMPGPFQRPGFCAAPRPSNALATRDCLQRRQALIKRKSSAENPVLDPPEDALDLTSARLGGGHLQWRPAAEFAQGPLQPLPCVRLALQDRSCERDDSHEARDPLGLIRLEPRVSLEPPLQSLLVDVHERTDLCRPQAQKCPHPPEHRCGQAGENERGHLQVVLQRISLEDRASHLSILYRQMSTTQCKPRHELYFNLIWRYRNLARRLNRSLRL